MTEEGVEGKVGSKTGSKTGSNPLLSPLLSPVPFIPREIDPERGRFILKPHLPVDIIGTIHQTLSTICSL